MINQKKIGIIFVLFSIVLLIILAFVKLDIDKKDVYLCELTSANELNMEECPAHKDNSSWMIIVAFGIAFIILFAGLYLIFIPFKKEDITIKKIDLSKLDENEKKIHDLLKQKEGSMYQSDLIKEMDFSKVQLTRILDKMEAKKIIGRERRGMTNIVVLK